MRTQPTRTLTRRPPDGRVRRRSSGRSSHPWSSGPPPPCWLCRLKFTVAGTSLYLTVWEGPPRRENDLQKYSGPLLLSWDGPSRGGGWFYKGKGKETGTLHPVSCCEPISLFCMPGLRVVCSCRIASKSIPGASNECVRTSRRNFSPRLCPFLDFRTHSHTLTQSEGRLKPDEFRSSGALRRQQMGPLM